MLDKEQLKLLLDWYRDTETNNLRGEASASVLSIIYALITGNRLSRVVQLGHYAGYSTIVIGCLLKKMGIGGKLVSFDIDHSVTEFTRKWVDRFGLSDHVELHVMDGSDP
jgi:predicted O-methyltransferase YrrM